MPSSKIDKKSHIPLKEQLRQWVIARVREGKLTTGDRIPSINTLARDFELSRETIRQSLDTLVARGFLIPEHGKGYFVGPRESRLLRVALLSKIDGVYLKPMYECLSEGLGPHASILVIDAAKSALSFSTLTENLAYHHAVDRLLVVPPRGKEEALSAGLEPFRRYFKVAWLDRAPKKTRDASFLCDYAEAVRLALSHFEKTGLGRRIYFSRQPEDGSVFSTMRAAFRGAEGAGARIENDWEQIDPHAEAGILCETDTEALFLQSRLLSKGARIPEGISIVSCDNSALTDLAVPAISSVDPGFRRLGAAAASWIRAESGNVDNASTNLILKPSLILKRSTR